MHETVLTIFVVVAAAAIVVQLFVLIALFVTTKKTAEQLKTLAARVEEQALPLLTTTRALVVENKPRVEEIISNVVATSTVIRNQTERVGATVDDVVDRTRLQVIRADEMVTKAFDRVEETADTMHHVVMSPMRRLSGVLTGLIAGFGEYVGGRKVRRTEGAVPKEDMFI